MNCIKSIASKALHTSGIHEQALDGDDERLGVLAEIEHAAVDGAEGATAKLLKVLQLAGVEEIGRAALGLLHQLQVSEKANYMERIKNENS
jgi:hypothetical protein